MARHTLLICDVCGNPTDELAGKLTWNPNIPGKASFNRSNYTHSAHIGICCKDKLFSLVKFQKRMTKTQYAEQRSKNKQRSTVRAKKRNNAA